MPHRVRVKDLYDFLRERLALNWLAGQGGRDRTLIDPGGEDSSRVIAGPLNYIHPNRIQIIGDAERQYLDGLQAEERRHALERLFAADPAAVVLVRNVPPPPDLLAAAGFASTDAAIPWLGNKRLGFTFG